MLNSYVKSLTMWHH